MDINRSAETVMIEGPDAIAFAQAQFSSKVASLPLRHWQFSAWLDPQGRVRALFHLIRLRDDCLLLLLRGGTAASLATALQPYVFRSKLTLVAAPQSTLVTQMPLPLFEAHLAENDIVLGCENHSVRICNAQADKKDDAWRLLQLREGWPWLPDNGLNKWLAASLSLQRLQAAALDKGCYPGQEIVARLHYRGGSRRHLHSVEMSHPCTPGESLCVGDQVTGSVVDMVPATDGVNALVILNDEFSETAVNGKLGPFGNRASLQLCRSWGA